MKKIITSILFIFSIIFLYAQINPIILKDFKGGLNTKISTNKLPINESPDLLNCDLDEIDGLKMRYGTTLEYTLPVSTSVKILSNFIAKYNDGTQEFIVQAGSVILRGYGDNDWQIITTISDKNSCSYTMFNDELWITNGIDNVGIWDRTNYTTYSFIPKGKYIICDKEQIIISGVYSDPSSIFYSSLFDVNGNFATAKKEEEWSALNVKRCGSGDGQIITGMFKIYDRVYVVKQNSIYCLLTQDNYNDCKIIRYTSIYGCANNQSIADYKNNKIILNNKGLIKYNGDIDVVVLTENINNIIEEIGILSTEEKTITTTTEVDFSTGVYENCWNNYGTIEISTNSKKWGGNNGSISDFLPMYSGSSNIMASENNDISLSTSVSIIRHKVPLTLKSYNKSFDSLWNFTDYSTNNFDEMINYDGSGATSFFLMYDGQKSYNGSELWVLFALGELVSGTSYQISSIEGKYQTFLFSSVTNEIVPSSLVPKYYPIKYKGGKFTEFKTKDTRIFNDYIRTSKIDNKYSVEYDNWMSQAYPYPPNNHKFVYTNFDYGIKNFKIDIQKYYPQYYNTSTYGYPEQIELRFKTGILGVTTEYNYYGNKKLDSAIGTNDSAASPICYILLYMYDFSVYTNNTQEQKYLTSGTYISPFFDTGATNTKYNNLYMSPYLGITPSTGSIKLYVRSAPAAVEDSYITNWFEIDSSSGTNPSIDNNRYFQWKAEVESSTNSITPFFEEAELKYCVTPATYTSKVFNLSKVSEWGSFLPTGSEDITYSIRAATYSFDLQNTDISWETINKGNNISFDTNKSYIQWRCVMPNKNSYIESVTITYYINHKNNKSGKQSTPSSYYKGRYYIGYSSYTNYNTDVLVYDRNGVFTRYDWKASGFAEFNNNFYILSSTIPYIYKLSKTLYTDNGSPINFYWKSPDYDFGESDNIKDLWNIYITGTKKNNSFAYIDILTNINNNKINTRYFDLEKNYNYKIQGSSQTYGKNISFIIRSTSTVGCEIQNFNLYLTKRQTQ